MLILNEIEQCLALLQREAERCSRRPQHTASGTRRTDVFACCFPCVLQRGHGRGFGLLRRRAVEAIKAGRLPCMLRSARVKRARWLIRGVELLSVSNGTHRFGGGYRICPREGRNQVILVPDITSPSRARLTRLVIGGAVRAGPACWAILVSDRWSNGICLGVIWVTDVVLPLDPLLGPMDGWDDRSRSTAANRPSYFSLSTSLFGSVIGGGDVLGAIWRQIAVNSWFLIEGSKKMRSLHRVAEEGGERRHFYKGTMGTRKEEMESERESIKAASEEISRQFGTLVDAEETESIKQLQHLM